MSLAFSYSQYSIDINAVDKRPNLYSYNYRKMYEKLKISFKFLSLMTCCNQFSLWLMNFAYNAVGWKWNMFIVVNVMANLWSNCYLWLDYLTLTSDHTEDNYYSGNQNVSFAENRSILMENSNMKSMGTDRTWDSYHLFWAPTELCIIPT